MSYDFHRLTAEPYRYVIPMDKHPKNKYGTYGADLEVAISTVIYCPVDITIPKVYSWELDAAPNDAKYFTGKFAPLVHGLRAVRFWFGPIYPDAGVLAADGTFHRKQKKGAVLGTAAAAFFHIGCNNKAALAELLGG